MFTCRAKRNYLLTLCDVIPSNAVLAKTTVMLVPLMLLLVLLIVEVSEGLDVDEELQGAP